MRFSILLRFLVLLIVILTYSCEPSESLFDSISRSLCENPNALISKSKIDSLPLDQKNIVLSMVNYNFDKGSVGEIDPKVELVQDIIYKHKNLLEVNKSVYPNDLSKIPSDQLETEIFIKSRPKHLFNNLHPSEINVIKTILKTKPESYLDWYNQIRLIQILGKHFETLFETDKSITSYLYGIHLIQNSSNPEFFIGFRDELINALILQLSKEENFAEYSQTVEKLSDLFSTKFKKSFNGLMREAYKQEVKYFNEEDNTYLQILRLAESAARNKQDSMLIMLNLGYYYSYSDQPTIGIDYFKEAINKFLHPPCTLDYFVILMTILEADLPPKEKDFYKRKLKFKSNCPDQIQEFVSFKEYQIYSPNKSRKHQIQDLVNESKHASKIESGRSLHLQDYYLYNLSLMCNLYAHNEAVEVELEDIIINKFYEVRARDLHRLEIIEDSIPGVEDYALRKRISEIQLEINNFKELPSLDNPIFQELFECYILEEKEAKIPDFHKRNISTLDIEPLVKDKVLLNIFRSDENYIAYSYFNEELRIHRFNTAHIDSTLSNVYNKIIKREEYDLEQYDLFKAIHSKVENKDLVIITDGVLVNFPLSEIFTKANNIYQYSDITQLIDIEEQKINPFDINIVSYSSDESIKSLEKRKYAELKVGLQECKEIASLLEKTEPIISGKAFNHTNSIYSGKKMLHLSTHARSKTSSRFDNYIVTRDTDQRLYGFELYESNDLPDVVVLSACESGIGLHAYGAGVQSISRAFLDNGSQTVIKTLWKVNEMATKEFMVEMYKNWKTNMSLHGALEKTKSEFETHVKYSDPYYWAGFVLEGNPNVFLDMSVN